jgi:dipeptidyl aminopeptidase/acylaminoacyl peptidase
MKKIFLVGILGFSVGLSVLGAGEKRAFSLRDVYGVQSVSGVCVSPNGNQLAFTRSKSDLKNHRSQSDIYLMSVSGKDTIRVTSDGKSLDAHWSTDAKNLYFTSRQGGTEQLYKYSILDKKIEKLTDFKLGVSDPVFSPDGKHIAFQSEVWPEAGADDSMNVKLSKEKSAGPVQAHVADALLFRHWTSYRDGRYNHVIVYDLDTKTYRDVTPGRFDSPVFSLGGDVGITFSPDGQELCVVSNRTAHPEANTNADLWLLSLKGSEWRNITSDNPAWDGSPKYSPDGHYIAYRMQKVEGYESDRFRIAVYDRLTGKKRVLTEDFDNWADDFEWSRDGRIIYFLGEERGYQPLFKVDLKTLKITKIIPNRAISAFEMDPKGNIYFTASTTCKPTALYKWNLKKQAAEQLTYFNQKMENEVDLRPSEAFWVKGAKGDSIEYFVVKPHNFDSTKKYPLIINVHGGPQMQWMNSYRPDWQVYPGAGYVLAYPNPHGSTGYGQKFTRAISGDWGGSPYEDVMAVTDALAKLNYVDSTRMGAMGWSYGGYMMNWLQGHTKRFKCLASMMGVYDLRSMWGSTEELWFPEFELGGRPWESALYEKWSPSMYAKNFATPTLVLTGELDYRVPYTQSLQYFTTLQSMGIPSRLIVFKYDGHWPSTLNSMPVYYNAHLEWFHQYLGGGAAPYHTEDMVNNRINY